MALDGIFLSSIINELSTSILNSKINKVNQPEKDEIILNIRQGKTQKNLLISASSNYPRIHFTNINKQNPIKAPMFCMVLRKYLTNSKIVNIHQIQTDRIVIIDFESRDELGFDSLYSLIVEIMGRHSNITLVRKRDGIIMDSIKHITPDVNSYRSIFPGIKYIYPPKTNKLNIFNYTCNEAKQFISENNIELNNNMFMRIFTGISKTLSSEISFNLKNNNIPFNSESLNEIFNYCHKVFDKIKNKDFEYYSYNTSQKLIDFYCLNLSHLAECNKTKYDSPSILLEDFYFKKDKMDRLRAKSSDMQKIVNNNIHRCIKKDKILNNTLVKCKDKNKYKLYGELLSANLYVVKKGMRKIEVLNYYSDNNDTIILNLNETKSPSQNVESFYNKYDKLKRSEISAHEQLKQNGDELNYLYSVLTNIQNASSYDEIEEIKKELIHTGYIRFKKSIKKKKSKASKPLHFLSSNGLDIYVGKNNMENDYLTLKFANKHDIWMHTKEIPGSHVIIKNTKEVSNETLIEGANLAAYYSKGKFSSNVPVDYTEVKNVKKPNGAKPGMVIYSTNQTLYITPVEPKLKQIK